MNKPATKEPSMDEILSSIRQIIADDDAATAPPPVVPAPAPVRPPLVGAAPQIPPRRAVEPLALSAAQIMPAREPAPAAAASAPPPAAARAMDFSAMLSAIDEPEGDVSPPIAEMLAGEAELVDPEDIAFEPEPEPELPPPLQMRAPEPPPRPVEPSQVEARPAPRPAASVAMAAPMPDPMLSSDMAEELLAPTTHAAVQGNLSRLSALAGVGVGGQTVEGIMREMLRPMLKEWLDENLPSLVERMVEKEIARISRGAK